jgi:hypothetical protein
MTGVYLYELDVINEINMYNLVDLSLYMMRSYNWKYLI